MFYSKKHIYVESGKGGRGSQATYVSMRKRRKKPFGGSGGRGGHIYIEAVSTVKDLRRLNNRYVASNGADGSRKCLHGSNGSDITVQVPLETACYDARYSLLMFYLKDNGSKCKVVEGSKGGLGNTETSNPALFLAKPKECKNITLINYWWTDIAILGSYNSGKSTLFNLIMKKDIAHVDSYPYTTKHVLKCAIPSADWQSQRYILDTPPIEHFSSYCCYSSNPGLIIYLISTSLHYQQLLKLVEKRLINPNRTWVVNTNSNLIVEEINETLFYKVTNSENLNYIAQEALHNI